MWSPSEESESEMKCRDKSATRLSRCPEVNFKVKKLGYLQKKHTTRPIQKHFQLMTVKAIETTSDALITLYLTQATKNMILSWSYWLLLETKVTKEDVLSSSPRYLTKYMTNDYQPRRRSPYSIIGVAILDLRSTLSPHVQLGSHHLFWATLIPKRLKQNL